MIKLPSKEDLEKTKNRKFLSNEEIIKKTREIQKKMTREERKKAFEKQGF